MKIYELFWENLNLKIILRNFETDPNLTKIP
jgi:hypothetical protein